MAEPLQHINYSFEDIQRYLQGKMSAREMHAIEKAALQDTFLADAIEGFNEADLITAQQHLNEINTSLIKEKKESKVVVFNKKTQWLNIAAVTIILAGIGVVASYFFQSSNKQNQLAQVKKEEVQHNVLKDSSVQKLSAPIAQPDSTLYIAQNKNMHKTPALKPPTPSKKKSANASIASGKDVQPDEATVTAAGQIPTSPALPNKDNAKSFAAATLSNNKDTVPEILRNKISGINIAPTIFSGKVTDEKNQPVAGAIVESTDKSITVLTDNKGDFTLWKSDTVLHAMASTVGYETKITTLKPGENNLIKLAQTNTGLNDAVVTTALGISRKSKALADSAMPVGGWANFNNYVITKLNKDTTAGAFSNLEDLVEMEFLIDNNGNPYNIKIIKPLDEQRDAKAIEILKSGPKWTSTSNRKKARVFISF